MSADVRVGLVGCGRLAELGYLPALRAARGARLAAVADPVRSRREALAPGLPAYASAAELVAAGGVDAVVLATPMEAHLDDAAAAAAAGLSVLVEKPPAPDAVGAAALAALDPLPFVGFNRRFDPSLRRLRGRVPPRGDLDIVLTLENPGTWRSHTVVDDALLGLGPHLIDLARWLAGCGIARVRTHELTHDRASLELSLERGSARIACARGAPHRDRVEVGDSRGGTIARHRGDGLVRRGLRRLARPLTPSGLVALLAREVEELARAARGQAPPTLATAADGFAVMATIDAARLSATSGGDWIVVGRN